MVALGGPGGVHESTLLLVFGDHGQTLGGDHGGGSPEEVDSALVAVHVGALHASRAARALHAESRSSAGEAARSGPTPAMPQVIALQALELNAGHMLWNLRISALPFLNNVWPRGEACTGAGGLCAHPGGPLGRAHTVRQHRPHLAGALEPRRRCRWLRPCAADECVAGEPSNLT